MKQCEICGCLHYCDRHHIQSKSKGGNNKWSNICNLCANCHRAVHMGDIIIEGRFLTAHGYQLIYKRKNQNRITSGELPEVFIYSTA